MMTCNQRWLKPCRSWLLAIAVAGWLPLLSAEMSVAEQGQLDVLGGRVAEEPAERMMARYLLARVNEQLAHHRERMLERTEPEQIRRWQMDMRQWFISAVGGLPPRDTPLQAQVTGTVKRDGYRVEKELLQSQPGLHVTAA